MSSVAWCLSCFVWIYFILFSPSFSCLSLSSLERLIKVRAMLLYLFTLWWGSHTSVCCEGILISCNFPALACTAVKCGKRQEDTDVDSMEWQMKNGCEIDTRVCCILRCIFLIKCRVPYVSGGHVVPTEESECKSIICFSFCGWNWSLSRWSGALLSRAMTERWKVGRRTWGLKWALI